MQPEQNPGGLLRHLKAITIYRNGDFRNNQ